MLPHPTDTLHKSTVKATPNSGLFITRWVWGSPVPICASLALGTAHSFLRETSSLLEGLKSWRRLWGPWGPQSYWRESHVYSPSSPQGP